MWDLKVCFLCTLCGDFAKLWIYFVRLDYLANPHTAVHNISISFGFQTRRL